MLPEVAPNQRIHLVKAVTARYTSDKYSAPSAFYKNKGKKMASAAQKTRPAHVPEENVYEKTHWLLVATYLVAALAVYLLIAGAG